MHLYRTGLLIIRAWVEKGSRKPLRAHIRATTDVSQGFKSELTVADVPSTSAVVETWLGDVLEAGRLENEGVKAPNSATPLAKPGSEHKLLDAFVGKWTTEGEQYEGPFGPAAKFSAMETYEWLDGAFFLVHRLDGSFSSNAAACVEIIGHDASSHSYPTHSFYSDGSTNEWQTRESGGTWTLTGDSPVQGKSLNVRCTTVFSDAGKTKTGRWEYSGDGSNWERFLDARATKARTDPATVNETKGKES